MPGTTLHGVVKRETIPDKVTCDDVNEGQMG